MHIALHQLPCPELEHSGRKVGGRYRVEMELVKGDCLVEPRELED